MRLLFDQNLSPSLARALTDAFPGSHHVGDLGLSSANDTDIWARAAEQGFVIVSKDSDFRQLAFVHGPPPKVVWVQTGNCTTTFISNLLRERISVLTAFFEDSAAAFLALG